MGLNLRGKRRKAVDINTKKWGVKICTSCNGAIAYRLKAFTNIWQVGESLTGLKRSNGPSGTVNGWLNLGNAMDEAIVNETNQHLKRPNGITRKRLKDIEWKKTSYLPAAINVVVCQRALLILGVLFVVRGGWIADSILLQQRRRHRDPIPPTANAVFRL